MKVLINPSCGFICACKSVMDMAWIVPFLKEHGAYIDTYPLRLIADEECCTMLTLRGGSSSKHTIIFTIEFNEGMPLSNQFECIRQLSEKCTIIDEPSGIDGLYILDLNEVDEGIPITDLSQIIEHIPELYEYWKQRN